MQLTRMEYANGIQCNHVIGMGRGVDESWLVSVSDCQEPDEPFNFCPFCGIDLPVGQKERIVIQCVTG
jgi:hypothetical protein